VKGALGAAGLALTIYSLLQQKEAFDAAYKQAIAEGSQRPLDNELRRMVASWGIGITFGFEGGLAGTFLGGPVGGFLGSLGLGSAGSKLGTKMVNHDIEAEDRAQKDPQFGRMQNAYDAAFNPANLF
jgi:hypothetical protein